MARGVSVRLPASESAPPKTFEAASVGELVAAAGASLQADRTTPDGGLLGCLACGHPELYARKDFPRRAGIAIVVLAAILAPFTSYASLVVAALLDLLLYAFGPEVVACYVCGAEHRGFAARPRHPRFDHAIAERLRFGERAVMGKPMRDGGTADAPEPEH
jgi:hypothetical protein